jgi:protease IV
MVPEADLIMERRFLKRRVFRWRIVAFVAAALLLAALGQQFAGDGLLKTHGGHIARVRIDGMIVGDKKTIDMLKEIKESQAKALLVHVDSPGGTTAGSEAFYELLREISAKKPTVAVVNTLAASGGYIVALGTDHIVARQTSLIGSIGVLVQYPNVAKLLDTVGIKMEEVKSSPLKAAPNGFEPTSPEARAALDLVIQDSYTWFKGLVKDRRAMSDGELSTVSDGRIFTGRQALNFKLVDSLGGEEKAVAWLETTKGVEKDLPIEDWKPTKDFQEFSGLGGLSGAFFSDFVRNAAHFFGFELQKDPSNMRGLISVWKPSS